MPCGRHTGQGRSAVRAAALKGHEEIHDWRIKQMVEAVHIYFADIWSKGRLELVDGLLDDEFVHKDLVWNPQELVVGPRAFKTFVGQLRQAYPDFAVRPTEVGVCDTNRLFVMWEGAATNLGEYHGHRPSHHASNLSGISFFAFTDDRSKIREVLVYRAPLAEDKAELEESEAAQHSWHELRLPRLHWEGAGEGRH